MGQLHVGRPACTAADRSADDFEIVGLLREAAVGAEAAITAICEGYRPRLRRLIRSWDGNRISPAEDEEDLAQEVLCLLHRYVLVGKFAQIATGNEFWNMTKQMTHNIVSSRRRHYGCRKRGGHRRVDADFDLESVPAPPPPE